MGLVAAVVAQGGVHRDPWTLALAGLVAMTVGDSASLATSVAGVHHPGGVADLGWLAGTWLLAAAAWSPDAPARSGQWIRGWVPVVFGAFALFVLVAIAVSPDPVSPGLGCAAGALAVVVARLAITLRENAGMLRVARTDSLTDALTGLPNRRRLMADLEAELQVATHDAPAALALFDLNGFKDYNDTFGHPAGDALLTELATGLAAAVEGADTAYRMGGDEFCVLIAHRAGGHGPAAERAARALSGGTRGFTVTAAYGIVRMPTEAASASDALRCADMRMYEHKAGGRVGSQRQAAEVLMLAVAERDPALHAHATHVAGLATGLARRLGCSDSEVGAVRLGALLHDVGKLAVPDHVLQSTAALGEYERALMRRHTIAGQRILEGAPALRDAALLVRSSHERFDGAGYPDGLRREEIPLGARIIAVCDAYDAMTRRRPYHDPVSPAWALAELRRDAGTHFDPAIVAAFAAAGATDAGSLAA
jgi:diguanylate cyclase (GGDEF)-like protein/putative nucleotidyltransferase with HDIG domain